MYSVYSLYTMYNTKCTIRSICTVVTYVLLHLVPNTYSRCGIVNNNLWTQNSSLVHALEATAPIWGNVLTTMLSSALGLALSPLPAPTPSVFIILKSLTGCDSSGSFFCGNQVPAKHWRIPAPQYFAGMRIPAQHRRIPAPHVCASP